MKTIFSISSLTNSCVSCGLMLWKCTESLANCGDHLHTQEGRQESLQ